MLLRFVYGRRTTRLTKAPKSVTVSITMPRVFVVYHSIAHTRRRLSTAARRPVLVPARPSPLMFSIVERVRIFGKIRKSPYDLRLYRRRFSSKSSRQTTGSETVPTTPDCENFTDCCCPTHSFSVLNKVRTSI